MQERGDSIWALTARLVAAQRDCSYVRNPCGGPSYDAVVLRGFHVDASELTPSAEAELPFEGRAFWRPDGVVTSLSDGSLHLLTWDAQGSLRAPLELMLGDAKHRPGPVDVVGNRLSVVDTAGDRRTLRIYDLEAGLDAAQRSADLGPSADALSEFSLFDSGKLWLSNGYVEDFSQLVLRGAGLPLGVDPPVPTVPVADVSSPFAVVQVPLSGAVGSSRTAEAQLREDSQGARTLQIEAGSSTVSFDVAPNAAELLAIPNGVIVVATNATGACALPGSECGGDAPGIAVYDLTGQPRLAGSAPLPSLPGLAAAVSPASATWSLARGLGESSATPLADGPLTLVADVDLLCGDGQTCAAIGISVPAGVNVPAPEPCVGPNGETCVYATPAIGESQRKYFYALSLDAALQPSWQPLGISTGESTSALPGKASKFGSTVVAGNVVGVTRFEPLSSSGKALPDGQARFMFDRFARSASGNGIVYPPTNILGQPIARFADSGSAQVWLSMDAPPRALEAGSADATGIAHLLYIDQQGAHDAQSLSLPGSFAGAVTLRRDDGTAIPVTLTTPANSCGTSRLTAFSLDASGALQSSTLDLPEDRWNIVAVDGPRFALQRDQAYALVELEGNALSVHSLRSSDGYPRDLQLLGTTLFNVGSNAIQIDF